MTPVKYHKAAEHELLNEISYLELRAAGLGRRLFQAVSRAERLLAKYPESAAEILPGIRRQPLRGFSYSLIYAMSDDGLLVLAVAHHRRRPNYWAERVSES
ncbi:MAG: type II toxin-antitoxin system RelE/ParE family toxin [Acidobacteria bacterium]|nr:type II toxin-antitoxin system RelE/ParE family toxin [Acidobacteriota bacterium]